MGLGDCIIAAAALRGGGRPRQILVHFKHILTIDEAHAGAVVVVCRGRHAVSTWQLLEPLAGGTASLLQWRLQTGRTHQIRVHAKHTGHPLLADEAYGGAAGTAVNAIGQGKSRRHVLPLCLLARVTVQFGSLSSASYAVLLQVAFRMQDKRGQ